MNPILEIGNSLIKFSYYLINYDRKVKLVITFFNKITLCIFFKNKGISYKYNEELIDEYNVGAFEVIPYEPFVPKYTEYRKIDNLKTDIKTIAWYLPQFHTFKENDEWWGEGFTEWTNVKKSQPRYKGHYQPRVPHSDIGYYDLSDINVMRKQAKLANNYGLYGFCFYHYYFSGKRLMEKPVDNLLKNKDININFCLSFANENWTRTWDGLQNNILIQQDYSAKDDIRFIKSLQKYFDDERYIRVDGKPMFLVYRPLLYPNIYETTERWRNYNIRKTGKDLFLVFTRSFSKSTNPPQFYGFDMYVDFSIYGILNKAVDIAANNARSYRDFVAAVINKKDMPIKSFKDLYLKWDNSPRRKDDLYYVLENFNFDLYRKWLRYNIEYTRKNFEEDKRFMFINAWNEWGEGTYLEPDEANGYTALDILAEELNLL